VRLASTERANRCSKSYKAANCDKAATVGFRGDFLFLFDGSKKKKKKQNINGS